MSNLGGNKPSYIWTVNGTRWYIIQSLAGSKILAQMYGDEYISTWKIPESQFDAEFTEAKDVPYMADILENAPIAGWSSRLLRADYAGFSTQVRRSSDNTFTDIGFIDSYDYDVAAHVAFVGGGNGFNRTWYDQFNAHNANNNTIAQQPQIFPTTGCNLRPAYAYDGGNDHLHANTLANQFSGVDNSFSWIAIAQSNDIINQQNLFAATLNTSFTPQAQFNTNTPGIFRIKRQDDTGANFSVTFGSYNVTDYFIIGAIFTPDIVCTILNDFVTITAVPSLGNITLDRFTIGAFEKGGHYFPWSGFIDEALIWDKAIGLDDLQAASFNMAQFYCVY